MEQLANNGNGNQTYVDDLGEAQKLFVKDLASTQQGIALDHTSPANRAVPGKSRWTSIRK